MSDIEHYEEDKIRELLIGRKVQTVSHDTLILDDGTTLQVIPNDGCGGCSSGWFEVDFLNGVDNAIMSVEFIEIEKGYDDVYQIFVYTEGVQVGETIVSVTGDVGNGYYGAGYSIYVTRPQS